MTASKRTSPNEHQNTMIAYTREVLHTSPGPWLTTCYNGGGKIASAVISHVDDDEPVERDRISGT